MLHAAQMECMIRPAGTGGPMVDRVQYRKPPIIEAVIELKFDEGLSERDLARLKERFGRNFPAAEEVRNFEVQLVDRAAARQLGLVGYKLTAKSAVDVVLIQQQGLTTSRLAPYQGWDHLIGNAKENIGLFEKVVGYKRISRIGTRFVNRIDIP